MIKPIETIYNGYRFRSRLEARWAVFFDALNIKYEYEPEGYQLENGEYYLPDFWLPEYLWWIEIKPTYPTIAEKRRLYFLAKGTKSTSLIISGTPHATSDDDFLWYAHYDIFAICRDIQTLQYFSDYRYYQFFEELGLCDMFNRLTGNNSFVPCSNWNDVEHFIKLDILYQKYRTRTQKECRVRWGKNKHQECYNWGLCVERCSFGLYLNKLIILEKHSNSDFVECQLPEITNAYLTSKQARFEHGERPLSNKK